MSNKLVVKAKMWVALVIVFCVGLLGFFRLSSMSTGQVIYVALVLVIVWKRARFTEGEGFLKNRVFYFRGLRSVAIYLAPFVLWDVVISKDFALWRLVADSLALAAMIFCVRIMSISFSLGGGENELIFEFGVGDLMIGGHASSERIRSTLLTGHQLVLGASGSGKTFSVLEPQVERAIKRGETIFIIDPKGDSSFRDSVWTYCKAYGRGDDFRYFSMSQPELSHQFNPFGDCSPNEIKDMIISATDWSEPHYKKIAELEIIKAIKRLEGNSKVTITNILTALPNKKELAGIRADLDLLLHSSFGSLINNGDAPSIFDSYTYNRVIFISLDAQAYPQESIQLGRVFLGAVLSLSNRIQTRMHESERKKTTVVVDEFGSFVTPAFINFVNKARASKFRLILATQSVGDLEQYSGEMRKQIIDSITNKIVMRMSDPESIEYCSKMFGTTAALERTTAMQSDIFGESSTGRFSEREVEKFVVHPKNIRSLDVGLGYLMTQSPFSIFACALGPRKNWKKILYQPSFKLQSDSSDAFEELAEGMCLSRSLERDELMDSAETL